jgi:hypothetical protein
VTLGGGRGGGTKSSTGSSLRRRCSDLQAFHFFTCLKSGSRGFAGVRVAWGAMSISEPEEEESTLGMTHATGY